MFKNKLGQSVNFLVMLRTGSIICGQDKSESSSNFQQKKKLSKHLPVLTENTLDKNSYLFDFIATISLPKES